ncbi:hypothetical protein JOC24_004569 [Streptomyces sp. HB132]|nr:hypothetical protein [Streptomyces sp. HB132]
MSAGQVPYAAAALPEPRSACGLVSRSPHVHHAAGLRRRTEGRRTLGAEEGAADRRLSTGRSARSATGWVEADGNDEDCRSARRTFSAGSSG